MSGSASIRNSRMKFAKGVLSAFMAVVTVVGFTPIVPYHAYADESEPAQEQPAVQESNELQTATAEQVAPSAPADEQTPATGAVAATEEGTQLSAAGEGATSLEPMAGVSCIWNNQYFDTVNEAIAAIEDDETAALPAEITVIGDSQEVQNVKLTKAVNITFTQDNKTLNMGDYSITVDGESASLTISSSAEGGTIEASGAAIKVDEGTFTVLSGEIAGANVPVVIVGQDGVFNLQGGSVSVENGEALSVAGVFAFTSGVVLGGILAAGGAVVDLVGPGSQPDGLLDNALARGTAVVGDSGIVLSDAASLTMTEGAAIYVSGDGISVSDDAGAVVDGSMVISTSSNAIAAEGGSVEIRNDAVISTLDDTAAAISAMGEGTVDVYSNGEDSTRVSASDSGVIVDPGGVLANVTFHEGVETSHKVPAASVAEGYLCTLVEPAEGDGYWVINQTPNLPVVKGAVLPYAGGQQPIVDLKGAAVLSETTSGDKTIATTDAGYTLEYADTVLYDAASGTLATAALGDYRVIATLEEGLTWPDGSTGTKVLAVSIVANKIAAPKGIDGLVYTVEEGVGVAQSLVDFPDDIELTSQGVVGDDMVVETNMGYKISFDKDAGITVKEADPAVEGDKDELTAVNAATYTLTLTLDDPVNTTWADGSTGGTLEVSIARLGVPQPMVGVGLTYAGEPISIIGFAEGVTLTGEDLTAGVLVSDGYSITLNAGTEKNATADEDENEILGEVAGIYKLDFVLDANHQWNDAEEGQETAVLTLEATIARAPVAQPTAVPDLTYTGAAQQVINLNGGKLTGETPGDPDSTATTNVGYTFAYPNPGVDGSGEQFVATDAGEYPNIVATLDDNHIWSDAEQGEELDPVTLIAEIGKVVITVPTLTQEGGTAEWTGEPIELVDLKGAVVLRSTVENGTVTAVTNKNYTLTYPEGVSYVDGKLYAIAVGGYEITATLDSADNYLWSDETAETPTPDPALRTFHASITKINVDAPKGVEHDPYTYDGTAKQLVNLNGAKIVDYSYDEEAGIVTATTDKGYALTYAANPTVSYDEENYVLTGTNAGAYAFTATLDDAHQWKDAAEGHEGDALNFEDFIARKAIDKPEPAADPITWTGEEQLLVAAGEGYTLSSEDEGVTIKEDGAYATAVGDYTITATLDNNYAWVADPAPETGDYNIDVEISANKVAVPEAVADLGYTGESRTIVAGGQFYQLKVGDEGEWLDAGVDATAKDVDAYTVYAKLADPGNYTWEDGTTDVKVINASIAKGQVTVPTQVADLEYTGAAQPIIEGGALYTLTPSEAAVEAGATVDATTGDVIATNAKTYRVTASLVDKANYEWANGTDINQDIDVTMAQMSVEAPAATAELEYVSGGQQAYAGSDYYTFTPGAVELTVKTDGSLWATDAGDYGAVATLNNTAEVANYKWSDNSTGNKTVSIHVARKPIEKPTAAKGLVYNRAAQTLVKGGKGYTLGLYDGGLNLTGLPEPDVLFPEGEDATAIDANKYTVIATLVDTENYRWVDGLEGATGYDTDPVELNTEIAVAPISEATVTASDMAYTGAPLEPAATVKIDGATLDYGTDYTVAYSNNKEVGTATITVTGKGNYTGTATGTFKIVESVPMFRLYNPNSGEHFYTKSTEERDNLKKLGWQYEGIGWYAPSSSNTPVYRLYNPNGGDHHYTVSVNERDMLKKAGWKYEGIGWYSDDAMGVKVLREYNPNATSGSHNFTTSETEHQNLVKLGWRDEGTAWYAVAVVS